MGATSARPSMSPEQVERYTRLGLDADLKEKAGALKQAMIEMEAGMSKSVGYPSAHFLPLINNLRHRLDEFEAAIKAKESFR